MKKLQILAMALVAVFALCAAVASSAFAEETLLAEWLADGTPITEPLAADTVGELLLADDNTLVGVAAVVCSGLFEGTVTKNGEDELTKLFNLSGTLIPTTGETGFLTEGDGLLCKAESPAEGCEASTTDIEAFPLDIPYLSLLLLKEVGSTITFEDMVKSKVAGGKIGYELMCLILGILIEDECTVTEGEGEVKNVTPGVEAVGFFTPSGTCTEGGAGSGLIFAIAGNTTTLTNGETLTASE